jgi:hypothetical protein
MAKETPLPTLWKDLTPTSQKRWWATHRKGQPFPKNDEGDEGPSAAAAKKVKVAPRKMVSVKPGSVRALNAARQQAYMAKGGRQPIGAMGSGGSNVMAGAGQSTIKDLKSSIKAGFNPKVSLDPYESERAKKTGPRSLKMKNESIDEALSPKEKRIFDLKIKMINKVANKKSLTKPSKVDEPRTSLRPSKDMVLTPKSMPTVAVGHYTEQVQIDEVTKKEAEVALGGPVKAKPKMPPGKQPAGYRYVRGLARKAMKAGMKKEEVEHVDEGKIAKALAVGAMSLASMGAKAHTDTTKSVAQLAKERPALAQRLQDIGATGQVPASDKRAAELQRKQDQEMPASERRAKELKKEEVEYIEEKLTAADPASKWISDFVKSDNPKFAGKSKKERIRMALGAKYAANRGTNEEVELDEMDKSQPSSSRGAEGLALGKKANPVKADKVKSDALKLLQKQYKKVKEDVELDEANMRFDYEAAARPKASDVKNFLNSGGLGPNQTKKDTEAHMKAHFEEVEQVEEKYMGFKAVMASAKKGGARNPAAVAAAIGRKKYGKEKFQAMAAAGKKLGEGMDPVGREDKDIDNDGDSDKTDVYLHSKRKAIGNAIRKKLAQKMEKKDGE